MNTVFLLGGELLELKNDTYPLFLTEVNHKTILETQVEKAQIIPENNIIFCVQKEMIKKYSLNYLIHELCPNASIIEVDGITKGSLCTALLSAKYIDNQSELLLLAINDYIDCDYSKIISQFRCDKSDAGVVSFHSIHPKYSYVKLNKENQPIEFCEKKTISKNALASFYYFKNGGDFISSAKDVIRKDSPLAGHFYISMAFNELILSQKNISVYQISNKLFHPLKTEMELAKYVSEYKERELFR